MVWIDYMRNYKGNLKKLTMLLITLNYSNMCIALIYLLADTSVCITTRNTGIASPSTLSGIWPTTKCYTRMNQTCGTNQQVKLQPTFHPTHLIFFVSITLNELCFQCKIVVQIIYCNNPVKPTKSYNKHSDCSQNEMIFQIFVKIFKSKPNRKCN